MHSCKSLFKAFRKYAQVIFKICLISLFVCLFVYSFSYRFHLVMFIHLVMGLRDGESHNVVRAGLTTSGLKGLSCPSLPSGGTPSRSHH